MMKLKEIYGNLARLLSNENLTVVHKNNVDTAAFDAVNRVLTLPIWEGLSDDAYQLLVGHETGHALYSPHSSPDNFKNIPESCIQVVEDARIEKLMKRRYPGMKRTFYNGYKFLYNKGFFDLNDQDINEMSFPDRVNLYFKIGSVEGVDRIDFTPEEKEIVDEIESVESFEDTLKAAERLYQHCKNMFSGQSNGSGDGGSSKKQKIKVKLNTSGTPQSGGGMSIPMPSVEFENESEDSKDSGDQSEGDNESGDSKDSEDSNGNGSKPSNGDSENSEETKDQAGSSGGQQGSQNVEDMIKTNSSLEEALKNLVKPGSEIHYVTEPKFNLDDYVVSPSTLKKDMNFIESAYDFNNTKTIMDNVISEYKTFKKEARKEVNYLVKEFECKKAADSYSRIQESKTGVLDTLTLHQFKYSDDIFKKNTTVPEGKNHGLIFILDWSGSMEHCILDTCKQLFKLLWFCRQVAIPFEVYAFSSQYKSSNYNSWASTKSHNTIRIPPGSTSLLNFISSKSRASVIDQQMQDLYVLATTVSPKAHYHLRKLCPNKLSLGGTPLNETLICLKAMIPQFQQKNRIQKLNCIILTDGEGCHLNRVDKKSKNYGISCISEDCYFLDEKLKTTYQFPNYYSSSKYTDVFLRNLKDNYPNVNFIGMRLINSGQVRGFAKMHTNDEKLISKIMTDFDKEQSCSITTTGYSSYFGISIKNNNNSTFTSLGGMMKTMKLNTKILSEFVSIIA